MGFFLFLCLFHTHLYPYNIKKRFSGVDYTNECLYNEILIKCSGGFIVFILFSFSDVAMSEFSF